MDWTELAKTVLQVSLGALLVGGINFLRDRQRRNMEIDQKRGRLARKLREKSCNASGEYERDCLTGSAKPASCSLMI
jgi:hypothetical protein